MKTITTIVFFLFTCPLHGWFWVPRDLEGLSTDAHAIVIAEFQSWEMTSLCEQRARFAVKKTLKGTLDREIWVLGRRPPELKVGVPFMDFAKITPGSYLLFIEKESAAWRVLDSTIFEIDSHGSLKNTPRGIDPGSSLQWVEGEIRRFVKKAAQPGATDNLGYA